MVHNLLDNLLKMYDKKKDDPFLQYGIAIEYRNAGDMIKALEFFSSVHKSYPNYVPNYYHYAQALANEGREDEARTVYAEGIAAAEKAGDGHALGELRQALEMLG